MYRISSDINFSLPVIDVQATSKKLKDLRESRGLTVSDIQRMMGMQNPQSIYTWENPQRKYLPCLENLIALAKIYGVSLDDLIVLKNSESPMSVCEPHLLTSISEDLAAFIKNNASENVQEALHQFYSQFSGL